MRKEGFYRICRNYGIPAAYLFGSMRDAGVLKAGCPARLKTPLPILTLEWCFLKDRFSLEGVGRRR